MESQYNSKRILKNTIFLYLRMIVVTIVAFFTVRITLRILGVEDYGIYNVVGGIVSFLGIISATMSSASQRYLAYDLGKEDQSSFQNTFSLLLLVYVALSIIIVVFGEALGPWFINNYLNIAPERRIAAQWVYQFSLFSFCFSLISTPYQSAIIANERMGAFAFVGLFDAFGKLIVTLLLYTISFDKLIAYGFLILLVSIVSFFIQFIFCRIRINGCVYHYYWNKQYLKEILGYTGWNLFGAASTTLNSAGISIVLNMFFGALINAVKGIADRVNSMVVSFSINFYQAISPQIIKTYAAGETELSKMLVLRSTKLSFYLLFVFSFPLIFGMRPILNLWLGGDTVTNDMIVFSRLILVYSLVNIFEQPVTMLIRATGNIKKYQIYVGVITLFTIPLCVILFLVGLPAYWSIIAMTIVYIVAMFVRLIIARNQVGLSVREYVKTVLIPIIIVVAVSVFITLGCDYLFDLEDIIAMIIALLVCCLSIWLVGLNRSERQSLISKLPISKYRSYSSRL